MRILNLTRTNDDRPGVREIARFDLQVTSGCRIYGCRLMEAPDGFRFIYGPPARGQRAATFSPEFSKEIAQEALNAYDKFRAA